MYHTIFCQPCIAGLMTVTFAVKGGELLLFSQAGCCYCHRHLLGGNKWCCSQPCITKLMFAAWLLLLSHQWWCCLLLLLLHDWRCVVLLSLDVAVAWFGVAVAWLGVAVAWLCCRLAWFCCRLAWCCHRSVLLSLGVAIGQCCCRLVLPSVGAAVAWCCRQLVLLSLGVAVGWLLLLPGLAVGIAVDQCHCCCCCHHLHCCQVVVFYPVALFSFYCCCLSSVECLSKSIDHIVFHRQDSIPNNCTFLRRRTVWPAKVEMILIIINSVEKTTRSTLKW